MANYAEGQTATDHKTGEKMIYRNGQWVDNSAPGAPVVAQKLAPQDKAVLDRLNESSASMGEALRQEQAAVPALQRLHPGPFRGAFLDAALPSIGGGFMDKAGATIIGGPAKLMGLLPSQDVSDYQTADRARNQRVLAEQILQKGPQTESDAARMAATTLGPATNMDVNNNIVASDAQLHSRVASRANFYANWAKTYGLNGVDASGNSVEKAFQDSLQSQGAWKVVK